MDAIILARKNSKRLKTNKIISDKPGGIILNKELSIDIDTIEDFHKVQKILSNEKKINKSVLKLIKNNYLDH